MKKSEIPMGKLNVLPSYRPGHCCEFCDKEWTDLNLQGVNICKEHKDMVLILRCPVCNLDLAIHMGHFFGQCFWCVVHRGFEGTELRKDSRFDAEGKVKPYWSDENIKARRKRAETLNRKCYGENGKLARTIEDAEDIIGF